MTIERLGRQLHKLELKALLKVEGAVKLECRRPAGTQLAHLNDLTATITGIRQTRADVVFSNGEDWELAIEELAAADTEQGFMVLV
jgi:hypothetical protein